MKKITILFLSLMVCFLGNSQVIKNQIPDKLVILTFDDATASQYSIVAPLLKQYGFGATFFVCEFPSKNPNSEAYMNWIQIAELNEMGFEVANHTRTHIAVGKASKAKIVKQLNYIENKCDSFNITKPSSFAYPGYSVSIPAIDVLLEKEYKFARVGGSRTYDPLNDHPLLIPSWATNADNKKQIMSAFNDAKNGKIVVLTIHGVPDVEHPWVNTPPQLFQEYLQYLSEHNFKVIAIRDLNNYIDIEEALETIAPDLTKQLRN